MTTNPTTMNATQTHDWLWEHMGAEIDVHTDDDGLAKLLPLFAQQAQNEGLTLGKNAMSVMRCYRHDMRHEAKMEMGVTVTSDQQTRPVLSASDLPAGTLDGQDYEADVLESAQFVEHDGQYYDLEEFAPDTTIHGWSESRPESWFHGLVLHLVNGKAMIGQYRFNII